jgi:hypothetical protein
MCRQKGGDWVEEGGEIEVQRGTERGRGLEHVAALQTVFCHAYLLLPGNGLMLRLSCSTAPNHVTSQLS